ncbi:F-box protein, partial [Trifolium medium]|nr:F-box protein [Trifolium medium]
LTNSLDFVVQVLHHCPKLQDLELYKEPVCTIDRKNLVEPEFVPHCLSSYLTTCTILNMGGLQSY